MNAPTLERWILVWRQVNATHDPEPVFDRLVSLYSEPHRHYHNLRHIADCLAEFDLARQLANDPIALELAIWFHDAIYDPHASDNEERSADLAKRHIEEAGGSRALIKSVAALVLATRMHQSSTHRDTALMIDVDLSILGQRPERFEEYEAQIRREYDWVPESTFAAKRAEILQRFLARERIFTTEPLFAKFEDQARRNLQRSIQRLGLNP